MTIDTVAYAITINEIYLLESSETPAGFVSELYDIPIWLAEYVMRNMYKKENKKMIKKDLRSMTLEKCQIYFSCAAEAVNGFMKAGMKLKDACKKVKIQKRDYYADKLFHVALAAVVYDILEIRRTDADKVEAILQEHMTQALKCTDYFKNSIAEEKFLIRVRAIYDVCKDEDLDFEAVMNDLMPFELESIDNFLEPYLNVCQVGDDQDDI